MAICGGQLTIYSKNFQNLHAGKGFFRSIVLSPICIFIVNIQLAVFGIPFKNFVAFTVEIQASSSIILGISIAKRLILGAINTIACLVLIIHGSKHKGRHIGHLVYIPLVLSYSLKLSLQFTIARSIHRASLLNHNIIITETVGGVILRCRHFQIHLGNAINQGSTVADQGVHTIGRFINRNICHRGKLIYNQISLVPQVIGMSTSGLNTSNILIQLYHLSHKAVHLYHAKTDIIIEGIYLLLGLFSCNLQALSKILSCINNILTAGITAGRSRAILPCLIEFLHSILHTAVIRIVKNRLYLGIVISLAIVVAIGTVFLPVLTICIYIPSPNNRGNGRSITYLTGSCQGINLRRRGSRCMSSLAGISLCIGITDIVTNGI